MSKIAFVFPGQGAQYTGMGDDMINFSEQAKEIFFEANNLLDFDLYDLCASADAPIEHTSFTQPALLTVSMMIYEELLSKINIKPDFTAGLSLGEYTALVVSGVLSFDEAVLLVRQRGICMENAGKVCEGAMVAVMKGNRNEITRQCAQDAGIVCVANYNSPAQVVISGEAAAVTRVSRKLENLKMRTIPLSVSGAFHSPLMEPAAEQFIGFLDKVDFKVPKTPYFSNVSALAITDNKEIKQLLTDQLTMSVLWEDTILNMISKGVNTFVEIGPGKTLSGLIKKIDRSVTIISVENSAAILGAANQINDLTERGVL